MFFKKKKSETNTSSSMKKVDKLVTSLIIGGAIGGAIFGASKTKKGKEVGLTIKSMSSGMAKKSLSITGKTIVSVLNLFSKKK